MILHHKDGLSLIGDVLFDPVFDAFIQLTGALYRQLQLTLLSPGHLALIVGMEAAISAFGVFVIWLHLFVGAKLLALLPDAPPAGDSSGDKRKIL